MSTSTDITSTRRRLRTGAVVVGLIAAVIGVLYRPWLTQWGSTTAERAGPMAGDELVADADTTWTRAVTIDGPPSAVWPWLVQMGEDKAGFYNYDWGEQLFLDPVHNATTIHPEWQRLAVGDVVHPKPGGDWRVAELVPERVLVLENPAVTPTDWTWAIELRPVGDDRTRLVTRMRSHKGTFFSYALDVPDLILFPRLLTGIEQRVEGTLPGLPGTHTGRPFPLARLPVHWWAAALWLVGLVVLAAASRRLLGTGAWLARRRHPRMTFWVGFVVGAGYLLMSDTPPVHFFTHSWAAGIALAVVTSVTCRRLLAGRPVAHGGRLSRPLAAAVETGLFVVLPVTAVWQAATALGWTTSIGAHIGVAVVAVAAAVVVATPAWSAGESDVRRAAAMAAVLAAAYAASGSGLAALLAAALVELPPPAGRPTDDDLARLARERKTALVAAGSR